MSTCVAVLLLHTNSRSCMCRRRLLLERYRQQLLGRPHSPVVATPGVTHAEHLVTLVCYGAATRRPFQCYVLQDLVVCVHPDAAGPANNRVLPRMPELQGPSILPGPQQLLPLSGEAPPQSISQLVATLAHL